MSDPQSPEVLPAGTVLDGTYRLTRLLGRGGMGSVYEGHHTGAGKLVAVKVMHRGLMAYPELLARFRREAKVTSELDHPHVVNVFGFGTAPAGEPYMVMEFLDGEDLQTRLERVGPLPLAMVAQIVHQVASALSEAHAAGVVHRDLKPDNVFLVRVADGAVFAKVVDFGLSKVLKTSATKLTVARAVFGTPEFMAPEQAEGRQDAIDHRSDQWSLACLAWFTATGCLPFAGADVNAILARVIAAVPIPPAAAAPALPAGVEKVLRRALSKHRSDRFPTIRAFARAFETAVSPASAAGADTAAARGTPAPVRSEAALAPTRPAAGAPPPAVATPADRPQVRRRLAIPALLAIFMTLAVAGSAAWLFRGEQPIAGWLQHARIILERR
jgi:serine/threonine-protein kinase